MGWSNTHSIWYLPLLDPFVWLRHCSFLLSELPFILVFPCFVMPYLVYSFVYSYYRPGSLVFVVRPCCWGFIQLSSSLVCALVFYFFSYQRWHCSFVFFGLIFIPLFLLPSSLAQFGLLPVLHPYHPSPFHFLIPSFYSLPQPH